MALLFAAGVIGVAFLAGVGLVVLLDRSAGPRF